MKRGFIESRGERESGSRSLGLCKREVEKETTTTADSPLKSGTADGTKVTK